MKNNFDFCIAGGGVMGTFFAYHLLHLGYKVVLCERDTKAKEATVRNFGQIVPSGLSKEWRKLGRKSLEFYKSIQQETDISIRAFGSLYVASNEEEEILLEELYQINLEEGYTSHLLNKESCLNKQPALNPNYVRAGLFYPEEITVEPHLMIHALQKHMIKKFSNFKLHYNTTIQQINEGGAKVELRTNTDETIYCKYFILCSGNEFQTLFPHLFEQSELILTKIQMMQTKPVKNKSIKGSILTGETIRRYEAFTECPSFEAIKKAAPKESFWKKYGIHILLKQAKDGSLILGDSHEYAPIKERDKLDFNQNMDINRFVIKETQNIFDLPEIIIQKYWSGSYVQCKTSDVYINHLTDKIHIYNGIGGKGMTASAGFTYQQTQKLWRQ